MSRYEELKKYVIPTENDIKDIDEGMWDILIELNKKGYKTRYCCEGHVSKNSRYSAYLSFEDGCAPKTVPPLFPFGRVTGVSAYSRVTKNGNNFYWFGSRSKKKSWTLDDEEKERQQLLKDLYEWAKEL